jgi:hypothetical protein
MLRHVALFRFRDGIAPERRAEFHRAVAALPGLVPEIAGAVAGPSLGLQPGFDYVLMIDVADAGAFAAYKAHPEHRRLIDDHIRPCVEETARAQVEL